MRCDGKVLAIAVITVIIGHDVQRLSFATDKLKCGGLAAGFT
jgi:hypothetical protein